MGDDTILNFIAVGCILALLFAFYRMKGRPEAPSKPIEALDGTRSDPFGYLLYLFKETATHDIIPGKGYQKIDPGAWPHVSPTRA